jgi:hypothetical protein
MKSVDYFFKASRCILILILLAGCEKEKDKKVDEKETVVPLFSLLPAAHTGITFENTLTEGLNTNVLMYEYFYNGGGVSVGDLNGDGLEDIYFTANMIANKLYLNKGGMKFEDIIHRMQVLQGRSVGEWVLSIKIGFT